MQEDSQSAPNAPSRPNKRRRVTIACDSCRERKVRCDGGKPTCKPCKKRVGSLSSCVYTLLEGTVRRVNEPEHIARLQRKIEELQRYIDETKTQPGNYGASGEPPGCLTAQNERPASENAADPSPSSGRGHEVANSTGLPESIEQGLLHPQGSRDSLARNFQSAASISDQAVDRYDDVVEEEEGEDDDDDVGDGYHDPGTISAMGASITMDGQQSIPHRNAYYGRSSILSLAQEVKHSKISSQRSTHASPKIQPESNYYCRRLRQPRLSERSGINTMVQAHFALPPREIADRLLDSYFSNVHIFYPYLHSVSFKEAYQRLWIIPDKQGQPSAQHFDIGLGGPRCKRNVFYCAVNAMFAIGCEFAGFTPAEKENVSSIFLGRIQDLLSDAFEGSTISHVQALLLVGHYLLATHYPSRCWNIVGAASRMAIGLGLHSSKFSDSPCALETEMRRRVWYGCYQMDMTVSMTLGRPPFVRAYSDVPLPIAIDDEYMKPNRDQVAQPDGTFPAMSFACQNIKLAKILGEILERIYHPGPKIQTSTEENSLSLEAPDYLHTVSTIDALMERFFLSLPSELNWRQTANVPEALFHPVFRRQANVLRARYLHLKILLLRPALIKIGRQLGSRTQSNLESTASIRSHPPISELVLSLYSACAVECVKNACELISSIQRATCENATGAWWYSIFYLMTCGIIIVLVDLTPSLSRQLDQDELDASWATCLSTLEKLENHDPRAQKYIFSLNYLRDQVRTRHNTPPRQMNNQIPQENDNYTQLAESSVPFHEDYHQDPWMTVAMDNAFNFTNAGMEPWESQVGEFALSSHFVDDAQIGFEFRNFL